MAFLTFAVENVIWVVPILGTTTMSYLRAKKRTLKDGTVRSYWCRVEGVREGGKVHQKVVEYLGVNPNVRTFPLDEALARKIAPIVATSAPPTVIMNLLKDQGFEVPFRPRQVDLRNNPPLRLLTLRIE